MEIFADPDALNSDLIVVVAGEVDTMSIWQCSGGQIAAVAILGCGNRKKTLLPKLNNLSGKRLILLFDADVAGKKICEKTACRTFGSRMPCRHQVPLRRTA